MTTKIKRLARGGAVMFALVVGACNVDTLLEVPDPDVALPETVQSKDALPAVLAAAIGDFMVAYNGADGQISLAGLFTDELIWAETFPTRFEVDVRSIQVQNGTTEGVFRNLHRARVSAARSSDGYQRLEQTSVASWAHALNLEGFTYIMFGENYCNGVPFSSFDAVAGQPTFGDPQTNDEMFTRAIALFDSALVVLDTYTVATAAAQRNLARIGKGRALLNQNQLAAAAAAVTGVPTNFRYDIVHSDNTTRQNNGLWSLVFEGRRFSVGQVEGVNGLPFRADSTDPRIPSGRGTGALAFGFDGATPLFTQRKHGTRTTVAPVATGAEARLIEAEENLRAGGATTWLATLNTLRGTTTPPLVALVDPVTTAAREDMVFRERAYWLALTSHRLGDMRRLVRQLGRAPNTVYPTGNYFKGGLYGSDLQFPIPFDELNNPKFQQCLDRNP